MAQVLQLCHPLRDLDVSPRILAVVKQWIGHLSLSESLSLFQIGNKYLQKQTTNTLKESRTGNTSLCHKARKAYALDEEGHGQESSP